MVENSERQEYANGCRSGRQLRTTLVFMSKGKGFQRINLSDSDTFMTSYRVQLWRRDHWMGIWRGKSFRKADFVINHYRLRYPEGIFRIAFP